MDVDEEIRENQRKIQTLLNINRRLVNILSFVDHLESSLDALSLTASRYLIQKSALPIKQSDEANSLIESESKCVDESDVANLIDNEDLPAM